MILYEKKQRFEKRKELNEQALAVRVKQLQVREDLKSASLAEEELLRTEAQKTKI
jgi:hypothetical protein